WQVHEFCEIAQGLLPAAVLTDDWRHLWQRITELKNLQLPDVVALGKYHLCSIEFWTALGKGTCCKYQLAALEKRRIDLKADWNGQRSKADAKPVDAESANVIAKIHSLNSRLCSNPAC